MRKTKPYIRLGTLTILVTFVLASIILCLYFFTGNLDFGFYGYFFFLAAVPINIIVFIALLVNAHKSEDPKRLRRSATSMLLNVPVAILYFGIGIYFTSVMRITIENTSGHDILDIKISGCEDEEMKELKNGDSKTIWIDINGDCTIIMSYEDHNGNRQNETIVGYVTAGMGQKLTYLVGQGENGW